MPPARSTVPGVDALLLVSFGGPERPEDVLPFLENVTRGRGIPRERLLEVAEHYHHFGGVSPINAQNRELIAALESDFTAAGLDLPVYWGNRNWDPYLTDTLRTMAADGVQRALAFVTAAYSSYSSCRQYREDIARAQQEVGPGAPRVDKLRHYYNHPGFIGPMSENVRAAIAQVPAERRADTRLAFTAHSIPESMARSSGPAGDGYVTQLREASRLVVAGLDRPYDWELVYQSRSGPPSQPWLEPDILDHINQLHADGVGDVVMVPIGFVSDHLEVLFDLDTEAMERAGQIGLHAVRAATVGADPRFAAMVRELVLERAAADSGSAPDRPALGPCGPSHDVCPRDCCPAPVRPGRAPAAAAAG